MACWRHALSISCVPAFAAAMIATLAATPSKAQSAAKPANSTLVFLQRSDVLLSPRFYRPEWRKVFDAFGATKVVWTYGADRLLADPALGGAPLQCTLPFWAPANDPQGEALACKTETAQPIGLNFAGAAATQYYPDVLSPAWLERQIAAGKALADRGCRHFMEDDPTRNVSRMARGGCHSPELQKRYAAFLKQNALSPSRDNYEAFQKQGVIAYHRALHEAIRRHVQAKDARARVTFAGNLTNHQFPGANWIAREFDFLVSELYSGSRDVLGGLRALRQQSAPLFGVSAVTYASDDIMRNRVAIAGAYALGMVPVAPWDVFLDVKKGRFFGNPSDYRDLFGFVRRSGAIFDQFAHEDEGLYATRVVAAGTGVVTGVTRDAAGNMTVRWEGQDASLQIPAQSTVSIGNRLYRLTGASNGRTLVLRAPDTIREGDIVVHNSAGFLVSLRRNPRALNEKVVHVINPAMEKRIFISIDPSWTPLTGFVLSSPDAGAQMKTASRQIGGRLILEAGQAGLWTIATNSAAR